MSNSYHRSTSITNILQKISTLLCILTLCCGLSANNKTHIFFAQKLKRLQNIRIQVTETLVKSIRAQPTKWRAGAAVTLAGGIGCLYAHARSVERKNSAAARAAQEKQAKDAADQEKLMAQEKHQRDAAEQKRIAEQKKRRDDAIKERDKKNAPFVALYKKAKKEYQEFTAANTKRMESAEQAMNEKELSQIDDYIEKLTSSFTTFPDDLLKNERTSLLESFNAFKETVSILAASVAHLKTHSRVSPKNSE